MLIRSLSVFLVAASMLLAGCASLRDTSRAGAREQPKLSSEDLQRFAQSRVFFGHQSVGNNILHGVELLYRDAGVPAPEIRQVSDIGVGTESLVHDLVGVNGDPQSKIDQFTSELETGLADKVGVVSLKFCYVDITKDTDVRATFDAYSSAMAQISRRYPKLRIVYTTVPLTTEASWQSKLKALLTSSTPASTADNVARENYNALVRAKYEGSGQLFDIARVESTAADGRRMSDTLGDAQYFMLDSRIAVDSGHLNDKGSMLAAQEFIRVVLR